jgi:hypothetical protein
MGRDKVSISLRGGGERCRAVRSSTSLKREVETQGDPPPLPSVLRAEQEQYCLHYVQRAVLTQGEGGGGLQIREWSLRE